MTVRFVTLGCKVNAEETQQLREGLMLAGFMPALPEERADLTVVNTCSVTHLSDAKSRRSIEAAKREGGFVAVLGCYVSIHEERIEGVDLCLDSEHKGEALERILDAFSLDVPDRIPTAEMHPRTRTYIKVQDGCDSYCSYCIIPYARGCARSEPEQEILRTVAMRLEEGFKEVVLTGIHLSSYGRDTGSSLEELIVKISELSPERIRLGSLEQGIITASFLETLQKVPSFCDHFHLSLQSGSEKVLRDMNRKYTPEEYEKKVQLIREYFPQAAITTDIIVGFPTEGDREFEETISFVRRIGFASVHVFSYSRREGTEAAKLADLDARIKKRRSAKLRQVVQEEQEKYLDTFVGKEVSVLFEDHGGLTPQYARVEVAFPPEAGTIQKRKVLRREGLLLKA